MKQHLKKISVAGLATTYLPGFTDYIYIKEKFNVYLMWTLPKILIFWPRRIFSPFCALEKKQKWIIQYLTCI